MIVPQKEPVGYKFQRGILNPAGFWTPPAAGDPEYTLTCAKVSTNAYGYDNFLGGGPYGALVPSIQYLGTDIAWIKELDSNSFMYFGMKVGGLDRNNYFGGLQLEGPTGTVTLDIADHDGFLDGGGAGYTYWWWDTADWTQNWTGQTTDFACTIIDA